MLTKLIENLDIVDLADKGHGVAKHEGQVLFVKDAVPGDRVNVLLKSRRKGINYGEVIEFLEYSESRVDPHCKHFGVCGGCQYQHIKYQKQLEFKQNEVQQAFTRIARMDQIPLLPIIPSAKQLYYRNKLEFTFSSKKWLYQKEIAENENVEIDTRGLGFHIPRLFDKVLDLDECYFQAAPSNDIRMAVRNFCMEKGWEFYNYRQHTGFLRNLIIRNTSLNQFMVILVFAEFDKEKIDELLNFIALRFENLTSIIYIINQKRNDNYSDLEFTIFKGNSFIVEVLEELSFKIGPLSFFQVNQEQALILYNKIVEFAQFHGNETVYDLYTGAGTIALFIAKYVEKVIGIESVASAIEDANFNMVNNGISNTSFYAGDIALTLDMDFVRTHGRPDVIITDPPRAGMHDKVLKMILDLAPEKLIYVSCNPSTQARDIQILSEKFELRILQPVDMFPHTHHVENIGLMVLKPEFTGAV